MERKYLKNKKGILGLDTVKAVILSLLVLAIVAVAIYAVIFPLRDSYESAPGSTYSVSKYNETITSSDLGTALSVNANTRNCAATVTSITNATGAYWLIEPGNYTVTGCTVYVAGLASLGYNGTSWNVTYSATWNTPYVDNAVENITVGSAKFFSQVPTFFVLLGVVVLILIIAIVILAVTRFQSEGAEVGKGEKSEGNMNI